VLSHSTNSPGFICQARGFGEIPKIPEPTGRDVCTVEMTKGVEGGGKVNFKINISFYGS